MARLNDVEKGYLGKLIATKSITTDGLFDMRGFDWSEVKDVRPNYRERRIYKVDFSESRAERGFIVIGTLFEECVFDRSMWWLAQFYKCKFNRCSFNNCRLYTTDLEGKFYNCTFKNLYAKGESFSFSMGSLYKNCIFESIKILSLFDEIGVKFEDCIINGVIEASKGIGKCCFRGRKYALMRRLDSVVDIFSRFYWPVKFIRCDLTGLETKNIFFEKDVVFKKCNGVENLTFKKN